MKITAKHIKALVKGGITADSHHASIKKVFNAAFKHKLTKDEVEVVRNLMDGTMTSSDSLAKKKAAPGKKIPKKKAAPVSVSPEELLKSARAYVKKIGQKGARVISVTESTPSGNPSRVVVKCADPQTNSNDESVCAKTREVAIQDVFQVVRCLPCQKRSVQIYRNRLARNRRKELRERRAS